MASRYKEVVFERLPSGEWITWDGEGIMFPPSSLSQQMEWLAAKMEGEGV